MTKKSLPMIVVLNGSPKAKQSITLQHIEFFMQQNKDLDFEVFNISGPLKKLKMIWNIFKRSWTKWFGQMPLSGHFQSITP